MAVKYEVVGHEDRIVLHLGERIAHEKNNTRFLQRVEAVPGVAWVKTDVPYQVTVGVARLFDRGRIRDGVLAVLATVLGELEDVDGLRPPVVVKTKEAG
jgi:hypothetical protein